ncbi:MAG: PilN domain-containing protein [Elusimicrobia bacterium]|nr:PilN domain-containing protein [Elusimicrobiota bacterium]
MIKINLVPQEILAKEAQRQQSIQAGIAGVIVLVLFGVMSAAHVIKAQRLEAHLKERQAEFDRLKKIVEQVEELERKAAAVRARLNVITDLLKGRPLYPYFMKDLVGTMPADVWFTGVTTTVGSGNQLTVTLNANSGSAGSISLWMRNIQGSGTFTEPAISGAISVTGTAPQITHTFNLITTYKNPKL